MRILFIGILLALVSINSYGKKNTLEVEVKESNKPKVELSKYKGPIYKSKSTKKFPYVCYEERIKIKVSGETFLRYKGCFRVDAPCKEIGRAHFGKYPNDYESYKAFIRCKTSKPRFVD